MILDHATSSSSSTTSSPTSKFKRLPSATTKIINLPNEKIQSSTNLKIDALQGYKKGTYLLCIYIDLVSFIILVRF